MPDEPKYLEEHVRDIKTTIADFRKDFFMQSLEMADRLARIETSQETTKEQVTKINGSVARSQEQIFAIQAEREKERAALVAVSLATAKQDDQIREHGKRIDSLSGRFTFFRGKTAGIVAAVSATSFVVFELAKLFIEYHYHLSGH